MKYSKKFIKKVIEWYNKPSNQEYLSRHPEFEKFDMPKTFYFRYLPDREIIHWAIIKPAEKFVNVYFIDGWGRVFDKLEFKNIKIARRRLRKNGFYFSTNRYCPFTPKEPIYIDLHSGKKTAPYSKGNYWKSIQRSEKHIKKPENNYFKSQAEYYERYKTWHYHEKVGTGPIYNTEIPSKPIENQKQNHQELENKRTSPKNNDLNNIFCKNFWIYVFLGTIGGLIFRPYLFMNAIRQFIDFLKGG